MTYVEKLVAEGYEKISNKYRILSRLPPGKTGLQALAEVDPMLARQFLANAEAMAKSQFLRVYSKDRVELNVKEFVEFRALGGRSCQ